MTVFLAGCIFGFASAGWFYGLVSRRPTLLGPGLDVGRAVRRPEVRERVGRALKGERA